MPVEARFEEPATFVVSHQGAVTYSEISAMLQGLLADGRLRAGARMLLLADGITSLPATSEQIAIAHELKPLVARGLQRLAVVAAEAALAEAAKVFAVFASLVDVQAKVFSSRESAEKWLAQ